MTTPYIQPETTERQYPKLTPEQFNKIFYPGKRVQLSPATDQWMRGDHYGTIQRITPNGLIRVKMNISNKAHTFHPDYVLGPHNDESENMVNWKYYGAELEIPEPPKHRWAVW